MPTLLDKMKFPPFFKSLTVGANSTDHPDQSIKSSAMTKSPKPTFSPISTPVMEKKPVRPQYSAALRTASYLSDHSACTQSSSDTWPALPVQDPIPIRPKLPTFLRSTSYRSERSCSSRATSRSRDMEKEVAHLKDCLEPVVSLLRLFFLHQHCWRKISLIISFYQASTSTAPSTHQFRHLWTRETKDLLSRISPVLRFES